MGVGIGFGLQKIASNLISGFLLLFDRSIRPGDVITIGESYGWVTKMSARYLVVRDLGGVDTLIPNEELITSQVKNCSYGDRHVRAKVPVQISYGHDPEVALAVLLEDSGIFPVEAFATAIESFQRAKIAEANMRAASAGASLAG